MNCRLSTQGKQAGKQVGKQTYKQTDTALHWDPKRSSEQIRLLHDAKELLLVDLSIAVAICFVNHLLELLVRHALTKLLRDALQVLERDLAGLVVVEKAERLQDLILRVAVQDLVRHHLEELLVLDRATAVVIDIRDHLLDFLLLLVGQFLLLLATLIEATKRHSGNRARQLDG